jgi:hypothetical protein
MTIIQFRPMRADDLPKLGLWLRTGHVARWWDSNTSDAEIAAKYLPCLRGGGDVAHFIILFADKPIGMIQAYRVDHLAGRRYGIDLVIGEPELIGDGIGTATMVEDLVDNVHAIRQSDAIIGRLWLGALTRRRWHVIIRYQEGHERRIEGFTTKNEAAEWIVANASQVDK